MRFLLSCFSLSFFLFAQAPPQNGQKPLVLTHVNIIDATGAPLKTNMTVVIADGRIAEIGESATIRLSQGARVVEAKDKFLIPGLWDMHIHWYHEGLLPLFIANGVTGARQMSGFSLHQEWREKASRGELLAPRLSIASMIVDGPGATWGGSFEIADEKQAREVVGKIKDSGFDFVKIYAGIPREAFYALADESAKQGLTFAGHVPHSVSALEASDAGMKSIEHMTGVLEACSPEGSEITKGYLKNTAGVNNKTGMDATRRKAQRALFEKMLDTYDRDRAAALFARFAKNGTWQCPTLVVNRVLGLIGDADFKNDTRLKYMPEYFRKMSQPENNPLWASRTAEDYAVSKRRFQKQAEAVAEMRRAGVRFIAGTDTGNPFCFPGFSLHDELALLVEAGFTPLEALQTATLNAAVFLGKADSLGTIEKGKIADLVLLEADPLENIGNTRKIAAVVLGGKIFEKPQLEAMLSDAEQLANKKTAERPVLLPLAMAATAECFAQTPAAKSAGPGAAAPSVTGQDHFAVRDGLRIHLWQKCLPGQETAAAQAGKVALLIHGSTWSGRPNFDLQVRDYSLMDFLARHGYDAWAIDIHGYGKSDKTDKDWSDTASAALDLGSALDFICGLRKISKVDVLGWSWGTLIAGLYVADRPDRIAKLILYGNVWKGRPGWKGFPAPKQQYGINTVVGARSDFIPGQFEQDVVDAYAREALKTDPQSPNGALLDSLTKLPLVDPERITVPTLIIRPEKDFVSSPEEMLEFFGKLKTADKSYVCLPRRRPCDPPGEGPPPLPAGRPGVLRPAVKRDGPPRDDRPTP